MRLTSVLIAAAAALADAFYRYVILPLRKMPAAAIGGQTIASPAIDARFRGVQGWLLFLCIWTTVLWPLFTFASLHRMSEEWMYLFTGIMLLAIISGIMLWRALPAGLVLVRTFLVVVASLNLISVFLYGASCAGSSSSNTSSSAPFPCCVARLYFSVASGSCDVVAHRDLM